MADTPYLSQITIFSFNFAPRGWAQCNGQLLPINQNQALFSLVGTIYGGNGTTTFALPDLRGRVPMHFVGSGNYPQGQRAGTESHTLITSEMPTHTHQVVGSSNPPNAATPANNFWASNTGFKPYNAVGNESMSPLAIANAGGGQAHYNMSPYLCLNICIALQGLFPSRN